MKSVILEKANFRQNKQKNVIFEAKKSIFRKKFLFSHIHVYVFTKKNTSRIFSYYDLALDIYLFFSLPIKVLLIFIFSIKLIFLSFFELFFLFSNILFTVVFGLLPLRILCTFFFCNHYWFGEKYTFYLKNGFFLGAQFFCTLFFFSFGCS